MYWAYTDHNPCQQRILDIYTDLREEYHQRNLISFTLQCVHTYQCELRKKQPAYNYTVYNRESRNNQFYMLRTVYRLRLVYIDIVHQIYRIRNLTNLRNHTDTVMRHCYNRPLSKRPNPYKNLSQTEDIDYAYRSRRALNIDFIKVLFTINAGIDVKMIVAARRYKFACPI